MGYYNQAEIWERTGVDESVLSLCMTGKRSLRKPNLTSIIRFIFEEESGRKYSRKEEKACRLLERSMGAAYQFLLHCDQGKKEITNNPPERALEFLISIGRLVDESVATDVAAVNEGAQKRALPSEQAAEYGDDEEERSQAELFVGTQSETSEVSETSKPLADSMGASAQNDETDADTVSQVSLGHEKFTLPIRTHWKFKVLSASALCKTSKIIPFLALFAFLSAVIVSLIDPSLLPQKLRYEAAIRLTGFTHDLSWREDTVFPEQRETVVGRFANDVGHWLLNGLHIEGHLASTADLADLLSVGRYVEKDPEKALELNKMGYESGDADAALSYAFMLEKGMGAKLDQVTAQRIYTELDERSDELDPLIRSTLWTNIGWAYWQGVTRPRDPGLAMHYLRLAYKLDNGLAANNLGLIYKNGAAPSIKRDIEEAKKYFKRAYELGETYGLANLVIIHRANDEHAKAMKIAEEAAEDGLVMALTLLGEIYETTSSENTSIEQAEVLYRRAVQKGDERAAVNLAKMIYRGDAAEEYDGERQDLYAMVEAGRNSYALYLLGNHYRNDRAILPRYERAAEVFKKSSNLGNADSAYNYASMAQSGKLQDAGQTEAISTYRISASRGNDRAKLQLAKIMLDTSSQPIDPAWGKKTIHDLESSRDAWVLSEVGYFYEYGNTEEKRQVKSFELYQKASLAGSHWATCRMAKKILDEEMDLYSSSDAVELLNDYAQSQGGICKLLTIRFFAELRDLGFDIETLKVRTIEALPKGDPNDVELLTMIAKLTNLLTISDLPDLVKISARGGNPQAMLWMADQFDSPTRKSIIENTNGDLPDTRISWLEKAAATGRTDAIQKLSELASRNIYPRSLSKAWLNELIQSTKYSENHDYEYLIAAVYLEGLGGVKKNIPLAIPWLEKAAHSVPNASILLARIYMEDLVVGRDYGKVLEHITSLHDEDVRQYVTIALRLLELNLETEQAQKEVQSLSEQQFHLLVKQAEAQLNVDVADIRKRTQIQPVTSICVVDCKEEEAPVVVEEYEIGTGELYPDTRGLRLSGLNPNSI